MFNSIDVTKLPQVPSIDQVCARFGTPRERVIAQYKANIANSKRDLEKAKASKSGKLRGFTVEQLQFMHDRIAKVLIDAGVAV